MDQLRLPVLIGLAGLVLEIIEFVYHALMLQGLLEAVAYAEIWLNAVQAVAFLASGFLLHGVIRLYTPQGIERRIEENMETIALLAGTRRRRRDRGGRGEGGGRGPREDDEEPREERRDERREKERRRGGRRDRIEAG